MDLPGVTLKSSGPLWNDGHDLEDEVTRFPDQSTLQPFLLPTSPDGQDLYLRVIKGEILYGDSLRTYGAAHISFNTYLSSFYEDYWIKHTEVQDIQLTICGKGRFWCNIFREAVTGGCSLIGRHFIELPSDGSDHVHLPLSLVPQGHGHGGRIFADLELLTTAEICAMSWCTRQRSRQEVSLGIGICAFNREPFVARTVRSLLSAPHEAGVASIAVVNQGERVDVGSLRRPEAPRGRASVRLRAGKLRRRRRVHPQRHGAAEGSLDNPYPVHGRRHRAGRPPSRHYSGLPAFRAQTPGGRRPYARSVPTVRAVRGGKFDLTRQPAPAQSPQSRPLRADQPLQRSAARRPHTSTAGGTRPYRRTAFATSGCLRPSSSAETISNTGRDCTGPGSRRSLCRPSPSGTSPSMPRRLAGSSTTTCATG